MKKTCLFLTCIVIIIGTIVACKREARNVQPNIPTLSEADINLINVVSYFTDHHNKGLDYVYEQLNKLPRRSNQLGRTEYYPPMEDPILFPVPGPGSTIPEFSGLYITTQIVSNLNDLHFNDEHERILDSFAVAKNLMFDHEVSYLSAYLSTITETSFSPALSTAIDSFQVIVENATNNFLLDLAGKDLLESTLPLLTDTVEKVILIAITKIGFSSYTYWNDTANFNKWMAMGELHYPDSTIIIYRNDEIKDILFADMLGAGGGVIKGAVSGAIAGSVTVPGVGTITGAASAGLFYMISGTITASAGAGLWGRIQKWIDWMTIPIPGDGELDGRIKNGYLEVFIKPDGPIRQGYISVPVE